MYTPRHYMLEDRKEMLSFMRRYPFGTIISAEDNYPVATHLPFIVQESTNEIVIRSHFAKANPQWKNIEHHSTLVIFAEPHAYISPKHYEHLQNVPTWNYMSVHAYGKVTLVHEKEKARHLIEDTINQFEESYALQWKELPEDYKLRMLNGIVAFELRVTELQGKKKLSQNKTAAEQQRIIDALSQSQHSTEQNIARLMEANLKEQ